jgi:HEAT repeat protein
MTAKRESDERLRRIFVANANGDTRYLIEALRDPNHRATAAKFLGELKEDSATEPLLRLLDARDAHARAASVRALGDIRAREAVDRLMSIAESDEELFVREWAIDSLGQIGDDRVTPRLTVLLRDPAWRIRRWTATVLGRIGDRRALDPLRTASRAESPLRRRWYRRAIAEIERRRGA